MAQEDVDGKFFTLVEEREEKMVSHTGGKPFTRLARFLKPSTTCMNEQELPPLPQTKPYHHTHCPFVAHFKGWSSQQYKWKQWVHQLQSTHASIWNKAAIYDSIITSTYDFPKNQQLVLGLAEFWCSDTNTFVFSWGEATITLEDMFILGGFSILGEPVGTPLTGDLVEIEEKMIQEYREISRGSTHKANHSAWIKHFMGRNDDLEHIAFLSLWLSRYVFPTKPGQTISKQVLPIAIHLSQATRIALAPAILASLYRDLRIFKEQFNISSAIEDCNSDDMSVTVWAPFHIMQIWAWERFPSLQPSANSLSVGEPRLARWHKHKSKVTIDLVRTIVDLPDDFQWRPYSSILNNWQYPLYHTEQGEWAIISSSMKDKELLSLSRCFVPCELVGLDSIEQYLPYRVGMQFGFDQDIPGPFSRANADWKISWRTNDNPIGIISFYVPPRLFESDVTTKYFDWRNQSCSIKPEGSHSICVLEVSSSLNVSSKSLESDYPVSSPLIASKQLRKDRNSNHGEKMTASKWSKSHQDHFTVDNLATSSAKYFSSPQVQSSSTMKEQSKERELMTTAIEKNSYTKVPVRNGNIFEEDKGIKRKFSVDNCSENNDCDGLICTNEFRLPELDSRIDKLEIIVSWLKAKGRPAQEAHHRRAGEI